MAVKAWRKRIAFQWYGPLIWVMKVEPYTGSVALKRICLFALIKCLCNISKSSSYPSQQKPLSCCWTVRRRFAFINTRVQDDTDIDIQSFCFWVCGCDGFVTSLLSLDFRFQLNIGNSSCAVSSKFRGIWLNMYECLHRVHMFPKPWARWSDCLAEIIKKKYIHQLATNAVQLFQLMIWFLTAALIQPSPPKQAEERATFHRTNNTSSNISLPLKIKWNATKAIDKAVDELIRFVLNNPKSHLLQSFCTRSF